MRSSLLREESNKFLPSSFWNDVSVKSVSQKVSVISWHLKSINSARSSGLQLMQLHIEFFKFYSVRFGKQFTKFFSLKLASSRLFAWLYFIVKYGSNKNNQTRNQWQIELITIRDCRRKNSGSTQQVQDGKCASHTPIEACIHIVKTYSVLAIQYRFSEIAFNRKILSRLLHVHCCPLILCWAVAAAELDSCAVALVHVYLFHPWSAPQVSFVRCWNPKSSMSGLGHQYR